MEREHMLSQNDLQSLQEKIFFLEERNDNLQTTIKEKDTVNFNLEELIKEKEKVIAEKDAAIEERDKQYNILLEQLRLAIHNRFGRKREKFVDPRQRDLFDDLIPAEEKEKLALEKADEEITIASHKRKKPGRKPLPDYLPREEIIHDLLEDQKVCQCGNPLHEIGEDVSEQLKYTPATFAVIKHIRKKYGCKACQIGVKVAELPKQPIPKSIATPGLLSQIITSKYEDSLPLYRQENIFRRFNINIPRGTLCNWMLKCAELFQPLIDLLKVDIVQSNYINCDETPVQVIHKDGKITQSKSYMFIYAGGDRESLSVIFDYQSSRSGESVEKFLNGFSGYLQTDAFSGYDRFEKINDITMIGCWAHARRKFHDIIKITKTAGTANEALKEIQKLYKIERLAKEEKYDNEEKKILRKEKTKPILDKFKPWLEQHQNRVPPKSLLGKAIFYTLNNWKTLTRYIDNGKLEIDNQVAENNIRPFALGRKNWLFCNNEKGAHASANIYSLVVTCKANKVEPYAYFDHILTQLPYCKCKEDYRKLLPQRCRELFPKKNE